MGRTAPRPQEFSRYRLNVVLKARQLGFTPLALCEGARLVVLSAGRTVAGLSRSEDEAKELVRRLGVILRYMPEFVAEEGHVPPGWDGPVFAVTALSLTVHFPDRPESVFKAFPSSPAVGRSFTADLIIIDEWAFQQFAQVLGTAFPVVNRPTGGRVIGLSTIKRGTLFEEIFTNPDNGFHKIFLPWSADPRRDEQWYRNTLGALGEDKTRRNTPQRCGGGPDRSRRRRLPRSEGQNPPAHPADFAGGAAVCFAGLWAGHAERALDRRGSERPRGGVPGIQRAEPDHQPGSGGNSSDERGRGH